MCDLSLNEAFRLMAGDHSVAPALQRHAAPLVEAAIAEVAQNGSHHAQDPEQRRELRQELWLRLLERRQRLLKRISRGALRSPEAILRAARAADQVGFSLGETHALLDPAAEELGVAAEALTQAWRSSHARTDDTLVYAWLGAVWHNLAVSALRRRRDLRSDGPDGPHFETRCLHLDGLPEPVDPRPAPEEALDRMRLFRRLPALRSRLYDNVVPAAAGRSCRFPETVQALREVVEGVCSIEQLARAELIGEGTEPTPQALRRRRAAIDQRFSRARRRLLSRLAESEEGPLLAALVECELRQRAA